MTLILVYQAGLANIFQRQSDGSLKRILQASFKECEWFMRGAQHAGANVDVAGCNRAGDIINAAWTRNLESLPFSEQFGCAWMQKQDSAVQS
jgi:hypothetical protein